MSEINLEGFDSEDDNPDVQVDILDPYLRILIETDQLKQIEGAPEGEVDAELSDWQVESLKGWINRHASSHPITQPIQRWEMGMGEGGCMLVLHCLDCSIEAPAEEDEEVVEPILDLTQIQED